MPAWARQYPLWRTQHLDPTSQHVLAIARDALDLDDAAQRRELIERRCGGEPALIAAVLRLTEAAERDIAEQRVDEPQAAPTMHEAGDELGPYRLLRPLGHGGMGEVWLAERSDGVFDRRVALKLLRGGVLRPDAQFARERAILARLDHPNIAQLFDGGTRGDQPWFALEYIDGEQIVDWCDQQHLDVRARVRLLLPICAAVQFAHRHLVVHRDIKPANVLVTREGTPKLLDFGIAKLLDQADPRHTQTYAMTPAYASPEQRRGDPVGTSGDVYQLGLLLFEVLGGDSLHAMRKQHGDSTLPRLDLALRSTTAAQAATIAECRGTSVDRLRRQLRGDLSRIVVKALADEPEERYDSALALAEDLKDWLDGRPVRAHRGSLGYRTRKFLRRHWGASVAALLLAVATAFYLVDMQAKNRRIASERDQARAVSSFLQDLFRGADPREAGALGLSARDVLDRGVARLEHDVRIEPHTRALLDAAIANSYSSLGLHDSARPLYRKALAALDVQDGSTLRQRARILERSVANDLRASELTHAEHDLADAESLLARLQGTNGVEKAYAEAAAARALSNLARPLEAVPHYDRAAALRATAFSEDPRFFAELLLAGANNEQVLMNVARAEQRTRESVALYRQAFGERDADYALALGQLADTQTDLHRYAEAGTNYVESIARLRQTLGGQHREVGIKLNDLGLMYLRIGRFDDARVVLGEAEQILTAVFGAHHNYVARPLLYLGWIAFEQGRRREARAYLERARTIIDADLANASIRESSMARVLHILARVDCAEGQIERALALFERARAAYEQRHDTFRGPALRLHHAQCLASAGRSDEARMLLPEAIRGLEAGLGVEAWDTRQAVELARALEPSPGGAR